MHRQFTSSRRPIQSLLCDPDEFCYQYQVYALGQSADMVIDSPVYVQVSTMRPTVFFDAKSR